MQNGSFSRHGQILIASLTLGAIAMIASTGWYYLRQRAAIEAGMTQELAAIAEIKVKQISNWRRERLGDGRVLKSSAITRIAGRLLSGRNIQTTDRADLLDTMQKLEREFLYTGAALVDRNGNICLESNLAPSDPSSVAELGRAGTRQTDVKLQDLYWDAKLARPLMALSVPVQGSGAFILTIDPDRFLYPFISSWPVPRATAETVLVRREGDKTLYLSDLRHRPGTAFRFWRPIRVARRAETETKFGWVFKQPDYRGVTVLGTVRSIPDSPWYLIAKIDVSEVDAPVWRLGWGMALIVALIALANMAGVGFIWRDRQLRIHRDREAWFQQVANETPAYLWMTSAHGENSFINEPLAQFVGGGNETLHKNWKSHFHPDDADRVFNKFFERVAARAEFLDEHQLRGFDGEYRWFIDQGRPRFSSQGEFLGYAGSLFDITERKNAERSAHESAELIHGQNRVLGLIAQNASLQETLDLLVRVIEALSPDMLGSILLLDPDGLHLRHSAAPSLPEAYTRAIDGAPIGAAAGSCGTAAFRRKPVVVEDIATDALWDNYRNLALENGLRACWSTPIFEDQQEQRHLLGTFALYFRSPGVPTPRHRELVAMATQTAAIAIVKNRETEALRTSEERLRMATASGNLGIWAWEIDTDRLISSDDLKAMFDWPKEPGDFTLTMFFEILIHPEDRERVEAILHRALERHIDYDAEFRIRFGSGSIHWIAAHGRTQYGPTGTPLRMMGTCQDITARKQAEQQLHAANAALAQELKERTRTEQEIQALSARLIHAQEEERTRLARELHDDLSQQIAALSIGLSNLKRVIPPELVDARDQSERIREKLIRLAENIRRLSHELHPAILQHCGLDIALRAYCSEFGALAGIGVAFHSDGSFDGVPPAIALCAYRIAQEGLQNVMKHARTDHADLALTHFQGTLRLTVSDCGIGMNLNGAGRVRGLGLISIKERTRLVNGILHIESQPNRGTTLTVTLPVPG